MSARPGWAGISLDSRDIRGRIAPQNSIHFLEFYQVFPHEAEGLASAAD